MQTVRIGNLKKQSYATKESLRALKTNIRFSGDDKKVIMVTSTVPDEGKSTVAMDLARSFVDSGKKVLVIDTDMRKSVLVGRLRATSRSGEIKGLSHYLSGQAKLDDILYVTEVEHFCMIFAGPSVLNPTEILEKQYFENLINYMRDLFDYIIVDCAPLGAAIDAAVVAKHCDGALLVIEQGRVGARAINAAKKQLEASGVCILGVVLNKVKVKKKGGYGYGYGYGYGGYGGYGSYGKENSSDSKGK